MAGAGCVLGLLCAIILVAPTVVPAQTPRPAIEGVVKEVDGVEATIDVGSAQGVQVGQLGTVYAWEPGRAGRRRRVKVADVKVIAINANSARLTIVASERDVERDHRVALQPFVEKGPPSPEGTRPQEVTPRSPSRPERKRVEAPCAGTLTVETIPQGASVFLDGWPWGSATPVTRHSAPCGFHLIRIALDGYEVFSVEVDVVRNSHHPLNVRLVPATVRVRLESSPAGATITVADHPPAIAPVIVDLPWGDYRVRAELEGYLTVERTLHVDTAGPLSYQIPLPPCRGQVDVVSEPPAARVSTDTGLSGVAPVTFELPCGRRTLHVHLSGRPEQLHQVNVEPSGRYSVRASFPSPASPTTPPPSSLPPPPAAVIVVTLPPLANLGSPYAVELDGSLIVDWRVASVNVTAPVTPGPHRLRILVKPSGIGTPQVLHDRQATFAAGPHNEIRVNFLQFDVTVNGQRELFNGPAAVRRR
jgi:PEGA domain-containing protein